MPYSKNLVSGFVFLSTAVVFGIASAGYGMGTLARVGPGLFPLILCVVLGILGLIILASGLHKDAAAFGRLPWRSIVLVVASPLVFVACVGTLGLVPSTALLAFVGSFASTSMTLRRAAASAVGLGLAVWLVFILGLGVTVPAFWWQY